MLSVDRPVGPPAEPPCRFNLHGHWLFLIGGLLMQYGQPNPVPNQPYTWIVIGYRAVTGTVLACSYLAVGTFALGCAQIAWIYPTEVPPVRVRATSVALATAANWAANFALGFAVPPLLRSVSWCTFFLFGSFNIAAFIHVLFALPQIKQRTLEEMDEIFEHGEPLWKSFAEKGDTDRLDKLAREIEMGIYPIRKVEDSIPSESSDSSTATCSELVAR